ncbi:hypothetical protein J2046_001354 [Rhizobium petrolearium]|uniref:hypothetical protein n=1 Tax=Neorhizobium petrolearium TaxID=515361 RepID=UPI001AE3CE9F|nr:hypothetical protein [Neorhizobium petrolearium]MBP1843100.1 hypothetical protein [Neorhizobium petrolearium]
MLPPVRATLSSFIEYQNPAQQLAMRQRITVANNSANGETIASPSLSGGRLDILSLSAQIQLAQGASIFAETIGKLIRVPRREGEALLDYARRLSEAVKAMNPAERAVLERMLNQLVKGVSLRLLAEILNNPAGPDAARLALRMETAQLLDRDLAAKAVVSSYRQNAGTEQVLNPPSRPANSIPLPPDQTVGTNFSSEAESIAASAPPSDDAGSIPAGQRDNIGTKAIGSGEASAQQVAAASVEADEILSAPDSSMLSTDTEITTSALPEESALHAENNAEGEVTKAATIEQEVVAEVAEGDRPDLSARPADEIPETPPTARRHENGERNSARPASGEGRASAAIYDGPALARLSQRNLEQTHPSIMSNKATPAATAEWLAEVFAEGNSELLEPLPPAAKPLPEHQELEERADGQFPSRPDPLTKEATADRLPRPAAPRLSEPDIPVPAARPALTQANTSGQPASASQLPEQFALPLPIPLREGIPLPFVPYPPEEREKDPEERKTREISKTDEDGEQQHSPEGQAFHENKSTEDQDEETGEGTSDEDAGRANDLYWRMAGWT